MKNAQIVFMGSPDFAVPSLEKLLDAGYAIPFVVTVPDKPAGRGLQLHQSAVKQFALARNIPVLQPDNLNETNFLEKLRSIPNLLIVVVAFRFLPEAVWKIPALGTINLHASLLPQYRGAAPINWAVINGETSTGLTTFFIDKDIDTGRIIKSLKTDIYPDETFGMLYNRLKLLGTALLSETVASILSGDYSTQEQVLQDKQGMVLKKAPKIRKEHCRINWDDSAENIHNLIRGLSPFPGAFTELKSNMGKVLGIKIYRSAYEKLSLSGDPGTIKRTDNGFCVVTGEGLLYPLELQPPGKKIMLVAQFVNGYRIDDTWKVC